MLPWPGPAEHPSAPSTSIAEATATPDPATNTEHPTLVSPSPT